VMPAIDLRDGACVQLVGGSYADERIREADPASVALRWLRAGFTRLHVVDLDAATGVGTNERSVSTLLAMPELSLQVGGGIRSTDALTRVLQRGAVAAVMGTRALTDPEWLAEQARRWPDSLIVAVDLRHGTPVIEGWSRSMRSTLDDTLALLESVALAGLLVTCVDVEGQMRGPDLAMLDRVQRSTRHRLIASGGITTLGDLRALRARGVWAAVVGMALYTGTLDARATAEEFGA
jgi:phosphoribosylformimino-5-aminoimidazole carboxamide ribotide isomerase